MQINFLRHGFPFNVCLIIPRFLESFQTWNITPSSLFSLYVSSQMFVYAILVATAHV